MAYCYYCNCGGVYIIYAWTWMFVGNRSPSLEKKSMQFYFQIEILWQKWLKIERTPDLIKHRETCSSLITVALACCVWIWVRRVLRIDWWCPVLCWCCALYFCNLWCYRFHFQPSSYRLLASNWLDSWVAAAACASISQSQPRGRHDNKSKHLI